MGRINEDSFEEWWVYDNYEEALPEYEWLDDYELERDQYFRQLEEEEEEWYFHEMDSPYLPHYKIDHEKWDNMSYHERLWEHDGYKDYWKHRNYGVKEKTANTIFKHSVGKNMSDIQKRIEPLLPRDKSFKKFSNWYLEKAKWHWRKNSIPDYYVDDNNILRTNLSDKSRDKQPLTNQEHFRLITNKKRKRNEYKKEKRTRGVHELKMINNPALHTFYLELKAKEKTILGYEVSYREYSLKIEEAKKDKYITQFKRQARYYKNMITSSKSELYEVQNKISLLESGNTSPYYHSVSYLHSLGKECHHF